ncbi:transaldolase [Deinococcus peraridilitoris]|uniref:Transaldolase n=1 Tax=Deinococcus peraridilitoris (strain DSM 19664 / LMG 22246 / CIP 109416 / KR-200) TaxID=937777 RepID=K9ZX91_DEIPD|nr:transaldolase [Deinococcus peraridilitoris]AFZ66181.1 transaldolase [Deinococcus peraridilitoris DSM 19664]
MSSKLEQLRQLSVVVADTGDLGAISRFRPRDCTTNPSLILKAAQQPESAGLVRDVIEQAAQAGDTTEVILDRLAVRFGVELTRLVPGDVSTEVDAMLSFDTDAMIDKARFLISLYQQQGVGKERILIKLAATWEGIRAAEVLEREGIRCNLTLVFGLEQAVACAQAGAFLISPFVGRITDWYKKTEGRESYPVDEDPGVQSVKRIYRHFKEQGYQTVVMGASFRSAAQVEALAGCDRLTVSPALLAELDQDQGVLERQLMPEGTASAKQEAITEAVFHWALVENQMAGEKLIEGLRLFHRDYLALKQDVQGKLELLSHSGVVTR